ALEAGLAPDAMFPDETGVVEVVRHHLGVGGLLVVVVEILAPAAGDALGGVEAEHPSGGVEGVDAVVAQLAGAVIPVPVPLVVKAVRVEGPLRGGAEPEVVIDALRHRLVGLAADARPVAGDAGARERHLAQLARADELGGAGEVRAAAPLGAK